MLFLNGFSLGFRQARRIYAGAIALLAFTFLALPAQAQVTYSGTSSTLLSLSSADTLSPIAVDASGDIFYVVNNGTSNTLYKLPSGGSPTALNTSFPYMPSALAVDPSGTQLYLIYFASSASCNGLTYQRVSTVNTTANATPADLTQCFTNFGYNASYADPTGLATDSSGNLYVADFGGGIIWKLSAPISSSSHPSALMDLSQQPYDIAILGSTIYYTALSTSSVDTLYSVSTSNFTTGIPSGAASSSTKGTVGSIQNGLAIDSSGNVYIGTSTSIQEYNGSSITTYASLPNGVSSLGVDSSNKLYFATTDASGNPVLQSPSTGAVYFGSVNVGSTSSAAALSFTIAASTTIGSIRIYTIGADNLDIADSGSSTCTAKTYSAATSCVVNVSFGPRYPGLRMGAVTMFDGIGNVLVSVPVYGIGVGPQVSFAPPIQSTVASGLNLPQGVAVDGGGNVYVADSSSNRVLKETLSNGSYTQSTIGSALTNPTGVAVDGGGNVYIADSSNNRVLKETLSNGSYAQSTVVSGLNLPQGVAVDGSGNVYIAESSNNRVLKETLSNGSYTQSTVVSGLNLPQGVAVDGSGNVYIADSNNNRVLKETLSSGSYTQSSVVSGLNLPQGVAVDGGGNVYIADSNNNRLLKETPSNGSYTQSTIFSGLNNPQGVAVDGGGDIYIARGAGDVLKEDVATPPSLSFASTSVGVQSSDSPKSVTVTNNGNAALTFPLPTSGKNPSIAVGFQLDSATTCPELSTSSSSAGTLAAGASCNYAVDFIPTTSGTDTGSLVLKDNNLNAAAPGYTTQTISLTGTASAITLTPSTLPSATVGVTYSSTLSGSGGNGSYTYSVSSGSIPPGLTLSSSGVLSGAPTAGGSFAFTILATDTNAATGSQAYTLTVSAPVITLSPSTLPSATLSTSYNQTITASGGTPNYIYTVTSGSMPPGLSLSSSGTISGTPTAANNYSFTITATDSSTGTGPYAASQAYTLNVQKATPTVSVTSSRNPSSINQSVTLTATIALSSGTPIQPLTGTVNFSDGGVAIANCTVVSVTSSGSTGTATCITSTLTLGQHAITATYSGDTNYQGSTSASFIQTVTAATATTVLTSSANPSTVNASVTVTASLTGVSLTPIAPSGTFTFAADGTTVASCTVTVNTAGAATCTLPSLTAGAHTVTATYSGDTNFTATTGIFTQQVNQASTTTTLTVSPTSPNYGQTVTLSAVVSPSNGAIPLSGTVTFLNGATALGTATITNGTAALTTSTLAAGSHTLTATYSGDTNYRTSTSGATSLTVNTAQLNVIANNATRVYGAANPTFSGSVTGAVNGDTFTESFSTNATLTSNVGAYAIVPSVTGANLSNYTVSTQNSTLTITQAGSNTGLSVSSSNVTPGQSLTLTATITSATSGTPTGTVSFYDGTALLGTATLSGGVASLNTTSLTAGTTNALTASYSGDVNFLSSSTTASVPVIVAPLDFTFTLSGLSIRTVVPGSSISYQAVIDPLYGSFAGPVSFSVTGLPPGATYTVTPSTLDVNAGKQNVALTIQTQSVAAVHAEPSIGSKLPSLALALLLLPLAGVGRMRRQGKRLSQWFCLVLLLGGMAAAITGCGSANGFFAQPQKSYDVTITATAGGLQHSATVTLEVQ